LAGLVTTSRLVFSYGTTWRLLVQTGSHGTEKNLIHTVQKSASGKFAGIGIDERASFFANFWDESALRKPIRSTGLA
jgi:hypothetical protein